jgi:hypothetical protein
MGVPSATPRRLPLPVARPAKGKQAYTEGPGGGGGGGVELAIAIAPVVALSGVGGVASGGPSLGAPRIDQRRGVGPYHAAATADFSRLQPKVLSLATGKKNTAYCP